MTHIRFHRIERPGLEASELDLEVRDGLDRVLEIEDGEGLIAFPGLINAHTHLDFDVFPTLANPPHADWMEWGQWVQTHHKPLITELLNLPFELRSRWGAYRQLLCGVTRVVNHRRQRSSGIGGFIENICRDQILDSVHDRGFNWHMLWPPGKRIHLPLCEGDSDRAYQEWPKLAQSNRLKRPVCAVHGLALPERVESWLSAIVWCPQSNEQLYQQCLDHGTWRQRLALFFGTDSTLSADGDYWVQLRVARERLGDDAALYQMISAAASEYWRCSLEADWVIAKAADGDGWDRFFGIQPADILLIVGSGQLRLVDDAFLPFWPQGLPTALTPLQIGPRQKHVVGDFSGLVSEIRQRAPRAALTSITGLELG